MFEQLTDALHLQDLFRLDIRAIWPWIDIILLTIIIYQLLLLIRGTRAVQILIGVAFLVLLYVMTKPGLIPLPAIHYVLGQAFVYIAFVIIVLFQNQIRQALARVGRNPLSALIPRRQQESLIEEISLAAAALASKRLGALIVIERELGLRNFTETGIALDALPTYDLLMNIFTKTSPLHDGAAIIAEGRIKAASCYLPLTVNPSLSRTYGTRHRAAIGITEESDAIAIVVSEETGSIGLAEAGKIVGDLNATTLGRLLRRVLAPRGDNNKNRKEPVPRTATSESDA